MEPESTLQVATQVASVIDVKLIIEIVAGIATTIAVIISLFQPSIMARRRLQFSYIGWESRFGIVSPTKKGFAVKFQVINIGRSPVFICKAEGQHNGETIFSSKLNVTLQPYDTLDIPILVDEQDVRKPFETVLHLIPRKRGRQYRAVYVPGPEFIELAPVRP